MVGGVPVLRGHDEIEARLQPVHDRDNRVSLRHRERAARHEVVLDINKDQNIHGS